MEENTLTPIQWITPHNQNLDPGSNSTYLDQQLSVPKEPEEHREVNNQRPLALCPIHPAGVNR